MRCAVTALNFCNAVAFMDITSIGSQLPVIDEIFHAGEIIAWASTAQLISATVGQCLLGYMSDVFGRRHMLLFSVLLLMLGSLLCAVSKYVGSVGFFIACRILTGVGVGSISSLVNIAQNDFLRKECRAELQGVQGMETNRALSSNVRLARHYHRYRYNRAVPHLLHQRQFLRLGLIEVHCFDYRLRHAQYSLLDRWQIRAT